MPLAESARRIYGPTTQRRWAYADSKAMDEFLALAHHQEGDLDCVIARLFNTVGARQSGQYGMVIPTFVERALAGEAIEIHGDGSQTRCFCHVQDTIRAVHGLMERRRVGEIYNVGSTNRISIINLADRIRELTGSSSEVRFIPYEQVYGRASRTCSTASRRSRRSTQAIGWQPEHDLATILEDVVRYERETARTTA